MEHLTTDTHKDDRLTLFTATQPVVFDESLADALGRLKGSLIRFQSAVVRMKFDNYRKPKGFGVVEIDGEPGKWHVHCHYVIRHYLADDEKLKRLWRKHSGGGRPHAKEITKATHYENCDNSIEGHLKRVIAYICKGDFIDAKTTDEHIELKRQKILGTPKNFKFVRTFGGIRSRKTGEQALSRSASASQQGIPFEVTKRKGRFDYDELDPLPNVTPIDRADWIGAGVAAFNQARSPRQTPLSERTDRWSAEDGPTIDGESSPEEGV